MTEKRFSIRLANGSEQTFDSASQLASWTRSQNAISKTPNPARKRKPDRRRPHRASKEPAVDGGLPLARYNRRQSGAGQG